MLSNTWMYSLCVLLICLCWVLNGALIRSFNIYQWSHGTYCVCSSGTDIVATFTMHNTGVSALVSRRADPRFIALWLILSVHVVKYGWREGIAVRIGSGWQSVPREVSYLRTVLCEVFCPMVQNDSPYSVAMRLWWTLIRSSCSTASKRNLVFKVTALFSTILSLVLLQNYRTATRVGLSSCANDITLDCIHDKLLSMQQIQRVEDIIWSCRKYLPP